MRTSLSHLPDKKQYEIARIVEIIKEVADPEKVILFGSHATGNWVEDRYTDKHGTLYEYISDYDFLVVTKNNTDKAFLQEASIMDRVDRYKPPVNLEIHEIEYINEGLEQGEYFFIDIVDEGIILYDKSNLQFASPKQLTQAEKRSKAQRYFDTWVPHAKVLLKGSSYYRKELAIKTAAFELHQAAESLYYAILLVLTDYKPKTHNLWKLRKKSKQYSKRLFEVFRTETDKSEKHLFDLLKRAYIDARYRTDYVITEEELSVLTERIGTMIELVEEICNEKIALLDRE